MAGGLALALVSTKILPQFVPHEAGVELGVFLGASAVGALLPDIDIKGSTISNDQKVLSFIVRTFFGHRGFTHSLLCLLALTSLIYSATTLFSVPFGNEAVWGFGLGYFSHLFLDALNPKGIPLFYPIKTHIRIMGIRTGGFLEKIVRLGLLVVIAWVSIGFLPLSDISAYLKENLSAKKMWGEFWGK